MRSSRFVVCTVSAAVAVLLTLSSGAVADDSTWDLSDMYPDVAAWEKARAQVAGRLSELEPLRGTLGEGAGSLKTTLDLLYDLRKESMRLFVYAAMLSDMDTRASEPQGMRQVAQQLRTDLRTRAAWIDPEILTLPSQRIAAYLGSEPGLAPYRRHLERLEKKRARMLDARGEEIMGTAALLENDGDDIGGLLLDTEMPWKTITMADGSEVRINVPGYARGRSSANRVDRIRSYDAFYSVLGSFQQTLAGALASTVKYHVFTARTRGYADTLEASLGPSEIDTAVYRTLIQEVNNALPSLHRYFELRARMLGLSDLGYHDLYPDLVGEVDVEYTWDASVELVLDAFAPMGEGYRATVRKAIDSRWVDVYPREGKRSGAYMNGSAYDVHPYMLLNHQDDYSSASTLAHEAGHLMHSAYSNAAQPYPTARYDTFVAEVASVTNEWLLFHHSLGLAETDDERLAILGAFLERMRQTVFRQTMFAEFERLVHIEAEEGRPLTAARLSEIYLDLLRRYHGHDLGVCHIDDRYAVEWSFIPHFHYNYYVYAYATSFIAATAFSDQLLNDDDGVERYVGRLLSAGASRPPVEILADAGVDMTTPEPFAAFVKAMNDIMDQIEAILDRRG